MRHTYQTILREFSQDIEEDLLVVGKRSRVDSAHISAEFLFDLLISLLSSFILELDNFAMPSFLFEALDDGDSVLTVSIGSLV